MDNDKELIENDKEIKSYEKINKYFNMLIATIFILSISIIYIITIFNFPSINSNLSILEATINNELIIYIKKIFSFLIPLSFFIFIFLFVLNPISLKSILISFILISFISFYLYKLPYSLILDPFENTNNLFILMIKIIICNFLILFTAALSYIRYDLRKNYFLYDFYTMVSEIIIWTFLILFIIFLILGIIFFVFYSNDNLFIKKVIKFLIRNDMHNLKIYASIFAVLKISVIYSSFILFNKMTNTKLSISTSRVICFLFSIISVLLIIFYFKYNLINNNYNLFVFLVYFIFMILFLISLFLFRIDICKSKLGYILYAVSNTIALLLSVLILYMNINIPNSFTLFFIIFNIIIIINFIFNIIIMIFNKFNKIKKFMFLYNFFYIILFIIILFY